MVVEREACSQVGNGVPVVMGTGVEQVLGTCVKEDEGQTWHSRHGIQDMKIMLVRAAWRGARCSLLGCWGVGCWGGVITDNSASFNQHAHGTWHIWTYGHMVHLG